MSVKTRQITMSLPPDLLKQLQDMASSTHRPPEAIVIDALQSYLPPLSPSLAGELAAWDALSDEAWLIPPIAPPAAVHSEPHSRRRRY